MTGKFLEVRDLCVAARLQKSTLTPIVRNVSFAIETGKVVALIGESGSGKTTISLACMGYARPGCVITGGSVRLDDIEVLELDLLERRRFRGTDVSYVAQSAAASFNAALTITRQVTETPLIKNLMSADEATEKAVSLYRELDLPEPEAIGRRYPHQVSGGQLQRLMAAMARHGGGSLALGLRRGDAKSLDKALRVIADVKADKVVRLQYTEILGEVPSSRAIPVLLGIMKSEPGSDLKRATLGALKPYNDQRIADEVLAVYGQLTDGLRKVAGTLLAGRPASAAAMLQAVDDGKLSAGLVSAEVISLLRTHRDERVGQLLAKHFTDSETDAATLEHEIRRLAKVVTAEPGSPYEGKKLFTTSCAACHRLFDQGGQIGPDLTAYQRDDLDTMLLNIINPSAEIREGYENFLLTTKDGRLASGFLIEQDNRSVVLRGLDGQDVTFAREAIRKLNAQGLSLMPGGLLAGYSDGQICDLMAYLRSSQPLNN